MHHTADAFDRLKKKIKKSNQKKNKNYKQLQRTDKNFPSRRAKFVIGHLSVLLIQKLHLPDVLFHKKKKLSWTALHESKMCWMDLKRYKFPFNSWWKDAFDGKKNAFECKNMQSMQWRCCSAFKIQKKRTQRQNREFRLKMFSSMGRNQTTHLTTEHEIQGPVFTKKTFQRFSFYNSHIPVQPTFFPTMPESFSDQTLIVL